MPHIPIPPDEEIPKRSKIVLDEFEERYSRPSHIFRAMSPNPVFLDAAWYAWKNIVTEPTNLERKIKEAIVVITASAQKAVYCWQGHSHSLRREGYSEDLVKDIQNQDFSKYHDPERSIYEFANKAAMAPKMLTPDDYDKLRKLGLTDEVILEILSVVWVNTAMNNVVDAIGMERTAEQLKELEINLEKR